MKVFKSIWDIIEKYQTSMGVGSFFFPGEAKGWIFPGGDQKSFFQGTNSGEI